MSQIQNGTRESIDMADVIDKKDRLRELVNWSRLHGLGNSKIVTLTVFTPFIGYAIIYHSEAAILLGNLGGLLETFGNNQNCPPLLDFQTRLSFFYIGLLLVGIGSILFKICAPDEVKEHGNQVDFAEKQLQYLTTRNFRSMLRQIRKKRPTVAKNIEMANHDWLSGKRNPSEADREGQTDIVRSYYTTKSRYTNMRWAGITMFVYFLGGIVLIIPSIEFTIRVVCKTFE